jgi:hypothetical protein
MPASIRGVLHERLDRLERDERAVLERAAVAGRSFTLGAVLEVSPQDEADRAQEHLHALVRKRFIRPDPLARPLQVWTGPYGWWDLTGLGTPARALVLTVLTVGLAALSYHLVERPVRFGSVARWLVPRRTLVLVPVALAIIFAVNTGVVVPRAGAALGHVTRTIVLVGDSVPQRLAPDLARAAAQHGYVVISATRGSWPATGVAVVGPTGKPWGTGDVCSADVPARQDAAIAGYHPALVIWWSRYELADRVDSRGRPVAFATRTSALTRAAAIVVAVQIERSGLGMSTRCTPAHCGPFLRRLVDATAAQDAWNAVLASHTSGAVWSISIQRLVCHDAASPCNDRLPDGSLARPDGTHYAPGAASAVAAAVIDRSLAVAGLPGGAGHAAVLMRPGGGE